MHNLENHRGISLLNATSKLFTAILAKRIRTWLEQKNKNCVEQAGYRTQLSIIDHVYTLYSMILKNLYGEGGGKLYVAFIDCKKAFDSVTRVQLWKVLRKIDISTKF